MKKAFLLLLFFSAFFTQAQDEHNHDHNHDHSDPHDHHNHIGLALGPVYILSEKEFAPGIHFHYARLLDVGEVQFGVGLGLEAILDEHQHYTTSVNLSFLPIHNLTFTVAPGAQFSDDHTEFTSHFEVSYEFIFDRIHLGPVMEYAYAPLDAHLLFGLHLGFGF